MKNYLITVETLHDNVSYYTKYLTKMKHLIATSQQALDLRIITDFIGYADMEDELEIHKGDCPDDPVWYVDHNSVGHRVDSVQEVGEEEAHVLKKYGI